MTHTSSLPSYSDIADMLIAAKSHFHPAQIHGLFCGYIAASSEKRAQQFQKVVLGKNKNPEYREVLQQLYEMSFHQMSEFSFEFALLLPDDDSDINARTEALGLWCQGFLTGLEQSKVPIQNREDSDVTETINDLIEIAKVNCGDIVDDDEDETAYFELVEYVRLSALMIFQELKVARPEQTQDENNSLH